MLYSLPFLKHVMWSELLVEFHGCWNLGHVVQNWVESSQGYSKILIRIWQCKEQIQFKFVFVYNLMTGCSEKNTENYARLCFWMKETRIEIYLRLGANQPLHNWALSGSDDIYKHFNQNCSVVLVGNFLIHKMYIDG